MLKALESIDIMMKRLPALLYLLFSILANSAAYGEEQAARAIAPEVTQAPGQERGQVGLASWYGGKFQGRRTANGEVFDTNKLTAAHKTLPFGTIVRVTNLENEKTSLVRINDRGPFVEGRIIDLSRAAAVELEMAGKGIARVRVETLRTAALEERYSIQLASFAGSDNAHKALAKLTHIDEMMLIDLEKGLLLTALILGLVVLFPKLNKVPALPGLIEAYLLCSRTSAVVPGF